MGAESVPAYQLFDVQTAYGTSLLVDRSNGTLFHGLPTAEGCSRVVACIPVDRPDLCLLAAADGAELCITLSGDPDIERVISLRTVPVDRTARTLTHPYTGLLLSAAPPADERGRVAVDREQADAGERFTFLPAADGPGPMHGVLAAVLAFLPAIQSTEAALGAIRAGERALRPLLRMLRMDEAERLGRRLRYDPAACAALAALYPGDIWAEQALPALAAFPAKRDVAGQPVHIREIGASLDADIFVDPAPHWLSFPQVCSTFARREHEPNRGVCLVAAARDEGPYLIEWIAYHRVLGVEAFFIYTNDLGDGSDELLGALAMAGVVNWTTNVTQPGGRPQLKAYAHALQVMPEILDFRWAAILDIDEFAVPDRDLYPSIPAFLAARDTGTVDAVALNWVIFGSDSRVRRSTEPVIEQFVMRDPEVNQHIKTFLRPNRFIHAMPHHPFSDQTVRPVFRHANGLPHPQHPFSPAPDDSHAFVAHFAIKSAEEHLLRRSRRKADQEQTAEISPGIFLATGMAQVFLAQNDTRGVYEDRLASHGPRLREEMARLRALPGVADAEALVERRTRASSEKLLRMAEGDPGFQEPGSPERRFIALFGVAGSAEAGPEELPTQVPVRASSAVASQAPSQDSVHTPEETILTQQPAIEGLIMDLGVSEGNDTAYYLSKGFKVVGVEADPGMYGQLRSRFAAEIAAGSLILLNNAVGRSYGETVEFHSHAQHQGLSGVAKRPDVPDDYVSHRIPVIDWRTLAVQAGVPRYLKIDVEGSEAPFLESMLAQSEPGRLPEFVSVECYSFDNVERLYALGYRRFVMVDQNPPGGLGLPERQIEGRAVAAAEFRHASGPFGLDVFIEKGWTDIEGLRRDWPAIAGAIAHTWFDCHAWLPN